MILLLLLGLDMSTCDSDKTIFPCFTKSVHVDVQQFDRRISLHYLNCTRVWTKNRFTITFEIQRPWRTFDHIFDSNMVVTLFSGPCSSSTATLSIGRTFPSIQGTLDGSDPSAIASSHLPWHGQSQQGTIIYEYGGSRGQFAQLTSVLIHLVIRYGREEMIKGVYVMKFIPTT